MELRCLMILQMRALNSRTSGVSMPYPCRMVLANSDMGKTRSGVAVPIPKMQLGGLGLINGCSATDPFDFLASEWPETVEVLITPAQLASTSLRSLTPSPGCCCVVRLLLEMLLKEEAGPPAAAAASTKLQLVDHAQLRSLSHRAIEYKPIFNAPLD